MSHEKDSPEAEETVLQSFEKEDGADTEGPAGTTTPKALLVDKHSPFGREHASLGCLSDILVALHRAEREDWIARCAAHCHRSQQCHYVPLTTSLAAWLANMTLTSLDASDYV